MNIGTRQTRTIAIYLASTIVLLASLFQSARAEHLQWLLISDVDDTIKISQLRPGHDYIGLVKNLANMKGAFVGMPQLYRAIRQKGPTPIYYVSSTPNFLKKFAQRFLHESRYPKGTLITRPKLSIPADEYKATAIKKIISEHPGRTIILLGDDGEKDSAAFSKLKADPEIGHRIGPTFIRQLYRPEVPGDLEHDSFITTADLAAKLYQEKVISEDQLASTLLTVRTALEDSGQGRVFPDFNQASRESVIRQYDELAGELPAHLRADLTLIRDHLVSLIDQQTTNNRCLFFFSRYSK